MEQFNMASDPEELIKAMRKDIVENQANPNPSHTIRTALAIASAVLMNPDDFDRASFADFALQLMAERSKLLPHSDVIKEITARIASTGQMGLLLTEIENGRTGEGSIWTPLVIILIASGVASGLATGIKLRKNEDEN